MGKHINTAAVALGIVLAAPYAHAQQGISPRQGGGLVDDLVRRGVPAQEAREGFETLAVSVMTGSGRVTRLPSGLTLHVIVDKSPIGLQGCRVASVNFVQGTRNASYSGVWCSTQTGLETSQGSGKGSVTVLAQQPTPSQPTPPQGNPQYGSVPNRFDVAERMDEVRMMRTRTPLYEQPNTASRNLGNLIENTRVHMTGHLYAVPGWVRIEVSGKMGYTQEGNLLPFQEEQQQARPAQPPTPIPPTVAATPEAVPVPVQRQIAGPVVPVPPTPESYPLTVPVVAAPAPVEQVPAPVVTAAPAAPARPAPVAQAAPTPAPAPVRPPRKPVDASL